MNSLIKRIVAEAAAPEAPPVEAPPETKPAVEPGRPAERPSERPNPWRRRDVEPGEEPAPKAAYGMDQTYAEADARRVVANMLEDHVEEGIADWLDRRQRGKKKEAEAKKSGESKQEKPGEEELEAHRKVSKIASEIPG